MHADGIDDCAQAWSLSKCAPSSIIEALQFTMAIDERAVKVVVLADVLIHRFGASEDPVTWLDKFETHCDEIVATSVKCHRAGADVVMLDEDSFLPGSGASGS
jgi:hypothetical protein